MKLRLFYRGEKEYRQKRKAIKRHDSDGETESEPEEKKVERRKKKFRLGLHEDQSFVDSPDAIYMWQFEATHPYTWLSGEFIGHQLCLSNFSAYRSELLPKIFTRQRPVSKFSFIPTKI